ncbi:type VI secretion system ATPase TssH, partial [Acinetobacter sp. 11520]|nr:type VI secretion system ATPase TssH [Acinetobacter sp. 11520]
HRQIPIHHERLEALKANLESLQKEIQQTEEQWQKELELVHKIQELEAQNHANESEAFDQINLLRKDLADIQGQQPLVFERVNSQIINEIISDWTGIPVGKMV